VDAVEDAAIRECMVDPVFDDASWAELVSVLNPSEWAELKRTVRLANQAVTETPKARRASTARTSPDAG
jgi:hypothetical protein